MILPLDHVRNWWFFQLILSFSNLYFFATAFISQQTMHSLFKRNAFKHQIQRNLIRTQMHLFFPILPYK